jgi:hypothetical protein
MSAHHGRSTIPKSVTEQIGRTYNLLYNRLTMYHFDHPSTKDAIKQLGEALRQGLEYLTPLAVILYRDHIYIEEEPLDLRLSSQRLVGHMKKAGIQSVSFQRGLADWELQGFAKVFGDPKRYTNSDAMKQGLVHQGIQRIRINHVFFKKTTVDEEDDDTLSGGRMGGGRLTKVLIDTAAEEEIGDIHTSSEGERQELTAADQGVLEELSETLSLARLVDNPTGVSQKLLETANMQSEAAEEGGDGGAGSAILHGIRQLREEVSRVAAEEQGVESLDNLVEAVFRFREEVRQGIADRRQLGNALAGEALIQQEMDDLTDQVLVQLVREEYRQGRITVRRLAQIIRRMLPDVRELKRLLPKLKDALLADGMSLADYLQLVQELERELQSDELAIILEEGAEEIGLAVDDLIGEIREDPRGAAELIALATELRSVGHRGDGNLLSQVLVDYVERISSELALHEAQRSGAEGVHRLREIVDKVQKELLSKLRGRFPQSGLMEQVQSAVGDRREGNLENLRSECLMRLFLEDTQTRSDPQAVLRAVHNAYPDPEQQSEVLGLLIQTMESQGLDPRPLQAALAQRGREAPGEADPTKVPKGTYNRTMILFFLREEVKRAQRYDYRFSCLLCTIRQATTLKLVPIGMIRQHEIRNAFMSAAGDLLRSVDLVGCLEPNKVLVLLPFTEAEGAEAAKKRIVDAVEKQTLNVRNIPIKVKVAVAGETYSEDKTPTMKALLAHLEEKVSTASA